LAALGGVVRSWGDRSLSLSGSLCRVLLDGIQFGYRTLHLAAVTNQNPELLQILIRQIGEDAEVDAVLGKALRVLPETELFEPIRNLLHRGSACEYPASSARIRQFILQIRSTVGSTLKRSAAVKRGKEKLESIH
jgi:hypothetical protein